METKIIPIYSLDVREFNSFEDYEAQYDKNCEFAEYTILSKHIDLHYPIIALTKENKVYEGRLDQILYTLDCNLAVDFIIFEDNYCGFINYNGDWIKLGIDKIDLKNYNYDE